MRIAIVRGANLNKWEMQNYEPLLERHEMVAYTDTRHKYDLSTIKIPIRRLPYLPEQAHLEYLVGLEEELVEFDVVFTADTVYAYSYQTIKAKERGGMKVVVHIAENIPFNYENNPMNYGLPPYARRNEFREEVRRKADFFIPITERAKQALIFEGVPEEKIRVIPWGVDLERFRPQSKPSEEVLNSFGLSGKDIVILYLGRFDWPRGVYDLIYATRELIDDDELKKYSLKVLFVGQGEEFEGMKWLVAKLSLERTIVFLEKCPYEKIHRLYNLGDIFIFPSIPTRYIKEQFGLAIVEAMACGIPVISTLCGSISEVVDDAGILAQPNDPLSLYGAMKELILNEGLRRRLGKIGEKRAVDNFDAKKNAEMIEDVFNEVLKGIK